jgi:hypothetical protein
MKMPIIVTLNSFNEKSRATCAALEWLVQTHNNIIISRRKYEFRKISDNTLSPGFTGTNEVQEEEEEQEEVDLTSL